MNVVAFSLPDFGSLLWTVLGIGLVLFVHELGHFLCARLVGVGVEVFSLGFGPRLVGFRRGRTDYRLSLVPVGGYVRMVGDQPGEGTGAPDELSSRPVGQRMLVFSGGVLMNILFALVAFPVIFHVGVPLAKPGVGAVTPGGPAWRAGLREGDEILAVDGQDVLGFTDVVLEVALGDPESTVLRIRRGDRILDVVVHPRYSPEAGTPAIGIARPTDYTVHPRRGGPAWRAGLRDGDRLVALDHRPVTAERLRRLDLDRPGRVVVTVERDGRRMDAEIVPDIVRDEKHPVVGVRAVENIVTALRGAFLEGGEGPLRVGDRLLAVDGRPVRDAGDLERWREETGSAAGCEVLVERAGRRRTLSLSAELCAALPDDVALSWKWPEGTPPPQGVPVRVTPGGPAARAGVRDGAVVVAVEGRAVHTWDELRRRIREADGGSVTLSLRDEGRERRVTLRPEPAEVPDYGFDLAYAEIVRRYPLATAFKVGMRASWNLTRQAYLTLRRMLSRQVSAENLGGIVAIGHVSYRFAQSGLAKLFYFLALLSLNLAVINLLPIPVLDGGHLLFLLVEKIKGSPVSERVVGYAQVVGFVFLLSLLIFVTFNDIRRLLG